MPPTAAQVKELFRMHYSVEAKTERARRAATLDTTRSWVDPNGYRLSDRVWNARQDTRTQIDQVLRDAIANGTPASQVAVVLESYLQPNQRPVRDPVTGKLVPNQPARIVTAFPDARRLLAGRTPSKGSFPARRLARTEITRAHGEATKFAVERNPLSLGVRWALSAAHPKPDPCDANASRDEGKGPGVYAPKDVPTYPNHPMCLCVLSPVTEKDPARRREIIAQLRRDHGIGELDRDAPAIAAERPSLPESAALLRRDLPDVNPLRGGIFRQIDVDDHAARARIIEEFEADAAAAARLAKTADELSLSKGEVLAVRQYTGTNYAEINGYARGTTVPTNPKRVQQRIDDLDRILDRHRLEDDLKVFRSIHFAKGAPSRYRNLKAGDELTDWGFMSTTANPNSGFTKALRTDLLGADPNKEAVLFEILAPRGTRGLPMHRISARPAEQEVLFPRGSRMVIREVIPEGRGWRVRAEMVDDFPPDALRGRP